MHHPSRRFCQRSPLQAFLLGSWRSLLKIAQCRAFLLLLIVSCGVSFSSAADELANTNGAVGSPVSNPPTNPIVNAAAGIDRVDALDDKYKLVIGDQLGFRIVEDEDDPVNLTVTDSGDIQVPYLGRYPAVGKTCKELALELKAELEKKYYYQATVIVAVNAKPRSRGRIYLMGAVRNPGPQEIASDETLTVSRAILRAGGFTEFANEKKVRVTRTAAAAGDGKRMFVVDVAHILNEGGDDLPLLPGDLVNVPERLIRF